MSTCLWDPVERIGGMNHFMLPGEPAPASPWGVSARFGVHAMELLINEMVHLGADRRRLVAKVFGGAQVLQGFDTLDVGGMNSKFVLDFLREEGIRLLAQDLLGVSPRKLHFFPDTGKVRMKRLHLQPNDVVQRQEREYLQEPGRRHGQRRHRTLLGAAMIKVLVIDDSAVMRSFLGRVVTSQPDMELAGVVSDPVFAIERIRQSAPDVITLDVEMPRMNGLDFLRTLMAARPLPVVMISSLTREGADATVRALELGAVDFFAKPASLEEFQGVAPEIAEKIRAAAQARVLRRHRATPPPRAAGPRPAGLARAGGLGTVIGIGASTGGVEALRELLPGLPGDMPPILIAQHMLPGFTGAFARRLDAICEMSVKEAQDGEEVLQGVAYVAPGGRHLLLSRRLTGYVLRLTDDPPLNRHRPSVDVLFRSMALAARERAVGVMLTGMGADGAQALLELREAGGRTLAQDEASSVVFGMPRQAIALGGAQEVLPLAGMSGRLRELAGRDRRRQSKAAAP